MALKKDIILESGVRVSAATVKVGTVSVTGKAKISFSVFYFVEAHQRAFHETAHECAYVMSGENPIKQAYEYLKTLPEFADAVDC